MGKTSSPPAFSLGDAAEGLRPLRSPYLLFTPPSHASPLSIGPLPCHSPQTSPPHRLLSSSLATLSSLLIGRSAVHHMFPPIYWWSSAGRCPPLFPLAERKGGFIADWSKLCLVPPTLREGLAEPLFVRSGPRREGPEVPEGWAGGPGETGGAPRAAPGTDSDRAQRGTGRNRAAPGPAR